MSNNEDLFCSWLEDTTDERFRWKTECGEYIFGHEQEPLSKWKFCPLCGRKYRGGHDLPTA